MKIDLAAAVVVQGRAPVNKAIEGEAEYVACSESSNRLTLSKERALRSQPRAGELGTRRYEGGKARSKQR